ncbi:DUF7331 family protein [Natronococcus wangiae]|uniref:DUF7331 family protein n=1 Tax=Natronococcus wangiae TaxID=3068275 RepID=UPI00273CFEC1|nr:hypothetical protein [Natronococcus sp. AD5]
MNQNSHQETVRDEPAVPEFDAYVSYDDDGATVICDRRNAAAWIRSTAVRPCCR